MRILVRERSAFRSLHDLGSWLLGLVLVTSCIPTAAVSQAPAAANPKSSEVSAAEYQTGQRVLHLLELDADVRTLPDVEVRSALRFEIFKFIYSQAGIEQQRPPADLVLTEFFEDLAAHEKEMPQARFWRNSLVVLIRKSAPELAKVFEQKYIADVDTSDDDFHALLNGAPQEEIVDRALERIRAGKDPRGIINIFETVKRRDMETAGRMILVMIETAEKQPSPSIAAVLEVLIDTPLNPPAVVITRETRLRYYRCLVAGANNELVQGKRANYLQTLTPLERTLPKIKEADTQLYSEAKLVLTRYRATLTSDARDRDQATERVLASENKLEQAIAEAEAAKTPQDKGYFWVSAGSLAAQKGDYRQAVDLLMKADADLGTPERPNARDEALRGVARSATRAKDYDSVNFVIGNIGDGLTRVKAMLEYAGEWGRLDQKVRKQSNAVIIKALALLETTTPDSEVLSAIGNTRFPLTYDRDAAAMTTQELTALAVRVVNKIPTSGESSQAGTPEHNDYITKTVLRAIPCVQFLFRPVMSAAPAPDPALAKQIKLKEWRLAAEISVEQFRRYTPPAEPAQ